MANLGPDQVRKYVGSGVGAKCLALLVFLKVFIKNKILKKKVALG